MHEYLRLFCANSETQSALRSPDETARDPIDGQPSHQSQEYAQTVPDPLGVVIVVDEGNGPFRRTLHVATEGHQADQPTLLSNSSRRGVVKPCGD